MNILTQRYVTLSALFADLPFIRGEWHDADHKNFTWGDCNRSMINKATFVKSVDLCSEDEEIAGNLDGEMAILASRLETIPDDVMIDLEN